MSLFQDGLFTSEAVSEGHPDKVADLISDTVLDACLAQNPRARAAVETLVTTNRVIVSGELGGVRDLDVEALVRAAIRSVGYDGPDFSPETVRIEDLLHTQSEEIASAVGGEGTGAGDQGLMFGYATHETQERMPLPHVLSHALLSWLTRRRKAGGTGLGPDAKSQVTVRYAGGKPHSLDTIVVSHQHRPGAQAEVEALVREAIEACVPPGLRSSATKVLVNPSGSFVVGGPAADTGLTGRKIIVDTYGGAAPHGGGAFSGKDPTKVDRSGAYAARWVAKNVVAAGLAERCLVQVAYVIGVARPVSFAVETFGTGAVSAEQLAACVDLTPRGIRERLRLERPIYAVTASGGHFGRTPGDDGSFSWEREDLELAGPG